MVKRLVRARSLSVRLLYSHFFSALKAVKPVNPVLPSCSGAEQRHADSCIWQERGLALQQELCKQRHLLPHYSPVSSSSLAASLHGSYPRNSHTVDMKHRGYCLYTEEIWFLVPHVKHNSLTPSTQG